MFQQIETMTVGCCRQDLDGVEVDVVLIVMGMLGRSTFYIPCGTIINVVEAIGCFMFFNA